MSREKQTEKTTPITSFDIVDVLETSVGLNKSNLGSLNGMPSINYPLKLPATPNIRKYTDWDAASLSTVGGDASFDSSSRSNATSSQENSPAASLNYAHLCKDNQSNNNIISRAESVDCGLAPVKAAVEGTTDKNDQTGDQTKAERGFFKTKICHFNEKGKCTRGSGCRFAHNENERREQPNLTKTRLCNLYRYGNCKVTSDQCPYAHGLNELRGTNDLYKTALCTFWKSGRCKAGTSCRHAHGEMERRLTLPSEKMSAENTTRQRCLSEFPACKDLSKSCDLQKSIKNRSMEDINSSLNFSANHGRTNSSGEAEKQTEIGLHGTTTCTESLLMPDHTNAVGSTYEQMVGSGSFDLTNSLNYENLGADDNPAGAVDNLHPGSYLLLHFLLQQFCKSAQQTPQNTQQIPVPNHSVPEYLNAEGHSLYTNATVMQKNRGMANRAESLDLETRTIDHDFLRNSFHDAFKSMSTKNDPNVISAAPPPPPPSKRY